jgi:hypothetical protein
MGVALPAITGRKGFFTMRCPSCGEETVTEAIFCHKCGQRLDAPSQEFSEMKPVDSPADASATEVFKNGISHTSLKDQPEKELWKGGYSPKAMFGGWAISGGITLILLLCGIFWVRSWSGWWILIACMILPWLYHLTLLFYRRMSVNYLLTSQRFVHESGLLRRITDRIEVLDMDDIAFEQKLIERFVGVGTIRISSSDRSHPILELPGIDNVKEVAAIFDNTRLAERRRRGLHIEQV